MPWTIPLGPRRNRTKVGVPGDRFQAQPTASTRQLRRAIRAIEAEQRRRADAAAMAPTPRRRRARGRR